MSTIDSATSSTAADEVAVELLTQRFLIQLTARIITAARLTADEVSAWYADAHTLNAAAVKAAVPRLADITAVTLEAGRGARVTDEVPEEVRHAAAVICALLTFRDSAAWTTILDRVPLVDAEAAVRLLASFGAVTADVVSVTRTVSLGIDEDLAHAVLGSAAIVSDATLYDVSVPSAKLTKAQLRILESAASPRGAFQPREDDLGDEWNELVRAGVIRRDVMDGNFFVLVTNGDANLTSDELLHIREVTPSVLAAVRRRAASTEELARITEEPVELTARTLRRLEGLLVKRLRGKWSAVHGAARPTTVAEAERRQEANREYRRHKELMRLETERLRLARAERQERAALTSRIDGVDTKMTELDRRLLSVAEKLEGVTGALTATSAAPSEMVAEFSAAAAMANRSRRGPKPPTVEDVVLDVLAIASGTPGGVLRSAITTGLTGKRRLLMDAALDKAITAGALKRHRPRTRRGDVFTVTTPEAVGLTWTAVQHRAAHLAAGRKETA